MTNKLWVPNPEMMYDCEDGFLYHFTLIDFSYKRRYGNMNTTIKQYDAVTKEFLKTVPYSEVEGLEFVESYKVEQKSIKQEKFENCKTIEDFFETFSKKSYRCYATFSKENEYNFAYGSLYKVDEKYVCGYEKNMSHERLMYELNSPHYSTDYIVPDDVIKISCEYGVIER